MEWFTLQLLWRPYFRNIHLYRSLGMVCLLQDTTLIVQANTLTDLIRKVSFQMLTCFNYVIWYLNPKPGSLAFNALLQSKSRSKISERCLLKFQSQNLPDSRCRQCSQQTSDRVIKRDDEPLEYLSRTQNVDRWRDRLYHFSIDFPSTSPHP